MARLEWGAAAALEPERAVFPVVRHHQRAARGGQREDRPWADGRFGHGRRAAEPREKGAGGDDATRGPVVAALPEDPQAMAERVVLDELPGGVSVSRFH